MVPFAYNDTRYDGELLRWKLMEYALDTTVLKKGLYEDKVEIEDKIVVVEPIVEEKPVKPVEVKAIEEPVVEEPKVEEPKEKFQIIDMRNVTEKVTDYCVQLYSDSNESRFMKTLYKYDHVKDIRGEIRGTYFTIRAGRYATYSDALKDVNYYREYFRDAFARECIYTTLK